MSIAIEELLAFADDLLSTESETAWRSAISRSYYAAFHRALAWEEDQQIDGVNIGPQGGAHRQLINRLHNPSRRLPFELRQKSMLLGTKLDLQRQRRVQADYRLDEDVDLALAELQVEQARQVIHGCATPSRSLSA